MEGVTTNGIQETTIANGTSASALTSTGIASNLAETAPSQTTVEVEHPLASLDASLLQRNITPSPRTPPQADDPNIVLQNTCTDHMVTVQWTEKNGWGTPKLEPYGPFSIMPTASVFHYATECFEGLKLYRGFDGKLRLFRPNLNCKRFLGSSTRIALPGFDPEEVLKLIVELCATDGPKWLPKEKAGGFLYLRPTMIANDAALGVQRPKAALLYVLLCVFPALDTPSGLKLLASQDDTIRAWPGGFGYAKVGANYGPSLVAQGEARKRNFNQILWLFGENGQVTEAGASNFFVVWKTREGKTQLVTAPLTDRIILDGVTRRSVLELSRARLSNGVSADGLELAPIEIVERHYTMHEVLEAYNEGRLVECFAAGTAFFIAQVALVSWKEQEITVPVKPGYATTIKGWLSGIMYGKEQHDWAVVVEEKGF